MLGAVTLSFTSPAGDSLHVKSPLVTLPGFSFGTQVWPGQLCAAEAGGRAHSEEAGKVGACLSGSWTPAARFSWGFKERAQELGGPASPACLRSDLGQLPSPSASVSHF